MTTKHEAVIAGFHAAVATMMPGIDVTREEDLPEECPDTGLVNLNPKSPVQQEHAIGGVREFKRACEVEIIVMARGQQQRIDRLEALLVTLGGLHASANGYAEYVEVDAPDYIGDQPVDGAEPVQGAVVEVTLHYCTGDNTLEEYP